MRVRSILAFIIVAATASITAQAEQLDGRVPYGGYERHRPRPHREWVRLASPTTTRYGTEYIVVGRDAGWFQTLRIQAVAGTVYVRTVRVLTGRRTWTTYYVNRGLDRWHPVALVDLGVPRQIEQLAVTTNRFPEGVYTVDGAAGAIGEVASR